MTPINSAVGNYGRMAAVGVAPMERPSATQPAQTANPPVQRPSAVVNISPEARERADAAERAAAQAQAQEPASNAPRAQAESTQASQDRFVQAAAAQNAGNAGNAASDEGASR